MAEKVCEKMKVKVALSIFFCSQQVIGDLHPSRTSEMELKTVILRQIQCSYDVFFEQSQIFGQIGVLENLPNEQSQKLNSYWFYSSAPASKKETMLAEYFCEFFYHLDRSKQLTIGVINKELVSIF